MRLFGIVDGSVDSFDRPFFFGGPFDRRWHNEFPTISRSASFENFDEEVAEDPAIRKKFDGGIVSTKARFTNLKDRFNGGIYRYITAADKVLLKNLQRSIKVGVMPFYWTNPADGVEYDVRLDEPIKFRIEPKQPSKWSARMKMTEA